MASLPDLDIEQPEALLNYLRGRRAIETSETPTVETLGGGVSNRVVLVRRKNGEAWVLKQALPKLRVAVDWFTSPERAHREATALRWLTELGLPVPALQFEDQNHHLLAMDAVADPHESFKTLLLSGRFEMPLVDAFARLLAEIHSRSSARSPEIEVAFGDRSYFESLRIEPYYLYTSAAVPVARDFISEVVAFTLANRVCLVHGDYSPKNILVHDGQLVLLDHEVAHFGDPAFDLGFSMTHLLSKANHLPDHRKRFLDATVRYWSVYWSRVRTEVWSEDVEARAVRSTLACLLARVDGRSPLEYLDGTQAERQRQVVLRMMETPPTNVSELAVRFIQGL